MTCKLRPRIWRALGFIVMISATTIGVLLGEALAARIGLRHGAQQPQTVIGIAAGVTADQAYRMRRKR